MNLGERLIGAVVNPVVGAVDVDHVVARVDVERVVNEVDVDALVARVDMDALLARVDVDALLDRIDVDELLRRVDVERLTARIDVQSLLDRVDVQTVIERVDIQSVVDRVDVNTLVERVDVNALVERIDVDAMASKLDIDALAARLDVADLVARAGIDDIVSQATIGVSTRVLNMARRQIVALDLLVSGAVARVLRRDRPAPPSSPSATGLVAGPVSRLLAYFADMAVITVGFSLLVSVVGYLVNLFSGDRIDTSEASWGWPYALGYVAFAFLYWVVGLSIAGSSPGKALLGLRVLRTDERPLRGRQAVVRVVVYPFSFILGLGLIPIVTARSHRALHDKAAGTKVEYDWGDSEAGSHSPLGAWLRGKPVGPWIDERPPAPSPAEKVAKVARAARAHAAAEAASASATVRSLTRRRPDEAGAADGAEPSAGEGSRGLPGA